MPHNKIARKSAAILAALYLAGVIAGCTQHDEKGELVTPSDGYFRINASEIQKGEARFYHYPVDGRRVVFMIARTPGGEIKTAFDACITCYPHKMGYAFETGRVICVKCGTPFELDELGRGKGNCVPIKIEHSMEDGFVLMKHADILSGRKWF